MVYTGHHTVLLTEVTAQKGTQRRALVRSLTLMWWERRNPQPLYPEGQMALGGASTGPGTHGRHSWLKQTDFGRERTWKDQRKEHGLTGGEGKRPMTQGIHKQNHPGRTGCRL